ncbi:hypothetical protein D3C71_1964900 [compost metagenome]
MSLTTQVALRRIKAPTRQDYHPSYAQTYNAFQLRWAVAVFGNSPAATLVFGAFLMLLAAGALSATAIARLLMHKGGDGHGGAAVAH